MFRRLEVFALAVLFGAVFGGQASGSGISGGSTIGKHYFTADVFDDAGADSPEGVVTAPVGSTYRRTNGATGTTLYAKSVGADANGWVALASFSGSNPGAGADSEQFGASANASGLGGTAIGKNAVAGSADYPTAIGFNATASGERSTAFGAGATASGYGSSAIGNGCGAYHAGSIVMGRGATSSTAGQVTVGSTADGDSDVNELRFFQTDNTTAFWFRMGGTSSSFSGWKRVASSTEIEARLGDDSASANVKVARLTAAGNVIPEAAGTRDLGSAAASWKRLYLDYGIDTTAGDAATVSKAAGRFRKDTSGTTFTLTNTYITANSIVMATFVSSDTTATSVAVAAGSGSAVFTFNAAPTSNCDVNFIVVNTD